jgi:hypothetical protein
LNFNNGDNMARKALTKREKTLRLLQTGKNVTWETLRSKLDLTSPRAMIDTLRSEGNCIYVNTFKGKTAYRMGEPSKGVIAAGLKALSGTDYSYSS